MGLLAGRRIVRATQLDFESGPVRLNIDDLNDIFKLVVGRGYDPNPAVFGYSSAAPDKPISVGDPSEFSALDLESKLMIQSGTNASGTLRQIRVDVTAGGVRGLVDDGVETDAAAEALGRIRRLVELAPSGRPVVERQALLARVAATTLLWFAWIWLLVTGTAAPVIVFSAVVVLIASGLLAVSSGAIEALIRRTQRPYVWFEPGSRREMSRQRQSSRRDLKVGVWSAIAGAVIGAVVLGVLERLLDNNPPPLP